MDLHRVTDDMKDLQQRLEMRARLDALSVAELYALAAAEQCSADLAGDEDSRRVHAVAALAAQSLADCAVVRALGLG